MTSSKWPEAQFGEMMRLRRDGFSASQIALALGNGITRNAVIGQLYRKGEFAPVAWTEERIAHLKELAALGLSGSQIARRLGKCSTATVNRKLNDFGIERVRSVSATAKEREQKEKRHALERKVAARAKNRCFSSIIVARAIAQGELNPTEAVSLPPEDIGRPLVALFDLQPHHCRWPISNAADIVIGFCGFPRRDEATSYCCRHAAISYRPPKYMPHSTEYFCWIDRRPGWRDVTNGGWNTGFGKMLRQKESNHDRS